MNLQTPSPSFLIVADFLIKQIEGGYSYRANDRGGETRWGISKRSYPHLDIANLAYQDAVQIYWRDYWCAARCDQLPVRMAAFVFDGAVNHGRTQAGGFMGAAMLQQALDCDADGVLGPQSLGRAWANKSNADVLPLAFALRARFYHDIVLQDSTQAANLKGWFKRLFSLQQFIDSIVTDPNEVRK